MSGIENLWLFVISGVLLNILPGPDTLYVVGRSATLGFRAGVIAALGISAGIMVHVSAAAFGLSAILASSSSAFAVMKILGCLYLVYLGASMLQRSNSKPAQINPIRKQDSLTRVFYQGFLTNVLNPKVALFFLAFVPQFITLDAPHKAAAFLFLGVIFNCTGMIWSLLLVGSSASLSMRFKRNERMGRWLNRAAGSLFLVFGLRLAVSEIS